MTGYIVRKSLLMIRRHFKVHLLFALQTAAGIAVIYACLTLQYSTAAQYREIKKEIGGVVWEVNVVSERPSDRPPLDYAQYARLKERFPEAEFPFCIVRTVYYTTDGTEIRTGRLLYASDDFLRVVLDADRPGFERGSAAYAGGGMRGLLEGRYRLIHGHMPPAAADGADGSGAEADAELAGGLAVLPMEELGAGRTRFTHHHLENVPLEQIALLPLASYYPSFRPEEAGMFQLSVRFGPGADEDAAIAGITEILGHMLEWGGEDYHFVVGSAGERLLSGYAEIRAGASAAGIIAGICLATVLIGLAAVAQILFLRRRRAFAVCSALGARKAVLFGEMLLEIALPSLMGGLLGAAACSWCLTAWVQVPPIRQSPAVMAAAAALALAPGMLAACALAPGFRRLRPIEMLRRDQA